MSEEVIFIGIPDLARKIGLSRQIMHHRARYGLLPIKCYPLRRNRQVTYIFDEQEAEEYVREYKAKKALVNQGGKDA